MTGPALLIEVNLVLGSPLGIFIIVQMTSRTTFFSDKTTFASGAILASSQQLQMFRVYTGPVKTDVIHSQIINDRAISLNPHGTMSQLRILEPRKPAPAVTLLVPAAFVFNTRIGHFHASH